MKKKVKKKRIKLKSILILLGILIIVGLLVWYFLSLKVKNIYVIGNNLLTEEEILEETHLIEYPKLYKVNSNTLTKTLLQNDLIKSVDIKKSIFGKITINILEENILFKKDNDYYLENGKIIKVNKNVLGIPSLINEVPKEILEKFINKFTLVDKEIRRKISEIEYAKTDLDDEKFLLYMSDGNYVYITLSKINLVNSYNEIYQTLGDNKGILYLDSGNHFQIKNNNEKNDNIENNE